MIGVGFANIQLGFFGRLLDVRVNYFIEGEDTKAGRRGRLISLGSSLKDEINGSQWPMVSSLAMVVLLRPSGSGTVSNAQCFRAAIHV